jgi:hypothetical protein
MNLAPIVLFVYKRLNTLQQTIETLKKNIEITDSELFIFSDASKSVQDNEKIDQVRDYIKTITGFKKITITEREQHYGLAKSIIEGVTEIMNRYGKVIVIEDDLLLSESFLIYMNQMLTTYQDNQDVFQIAGFGLKIRKSKNYDYDVYFHNRPNPWGWGTWIDRWNSVDWDVKNWSSIKNNKKEQNAFNDAGSDLFKMLKRNMEKQNDSWFVRFAYSQSLQKKQAITPIKSLVINNGFIKESTHCNTYNRYKTDFQKGIKTEFIAPEKMLINKSLIKQAYRYYSIPTRILSKIKTIFIRLVR